MVHPLDRPRLRRLGELMFEVSAGNLTTRDPILELVETLMINLIDHALSAIRRAIVAGGCWRLPIIGLALCFGRGGAGDHSGGSKFASAKLTQPSERSAMKLRASQTAGGSGTVHQPTFDSDEGTESKPIITLRLICGEVTVTVTDPGVIECMLEAERDRRQQEAAAGG